MKKYQVIKSLKWFKNPKKWENFPHDHIQSKKMYSILKKEVKALN